MSSKTYSEMKRMSSFEDRFNYLKLTGTVGASTFGYDRYLNQKFYKSSEWKKIRDSVIVRDNGCDLGISDRPINGKILIHHINPIDEDSIAESKDILFDTNNLVCVSQETHNAIHFGNENNLPKKDIITRTKNDTIPWKK